MSNPYGAVVLDHFRRPRNQRTLARPTATHEGYNALCGDRVRIELDVEGEKIRDAAFTANACAICTASASLLTERVTGEDVAVAAAITDADVLATLGPDIPASRESCATLPVHTFREALGRLLPAP